jgi:hypothetical protein
MKETMVALKRIEIQSVEIPVKGTAPLITHAWSQKAKQMMLDKQQGKKAPKELKDPAADYEASLYRLGDGSFGFPTTAFKLATVGGARFFKGSVTMASLKPLLFFRADDPAAALTRIVGAPQPREDMVRVGMGTADIRYRAEFAEWSAVLVVEFAPHLIDTDSVFALVDAGGRIGIGEWRPEKGGTFGTYEVTA